MNTAFVRILPVSAYKTKDRDSASAKKSAVSHFCTPVSRYADIARYIRGIVVHLRGSSVPRERTRGIIMHVGTREKL